MERHDLHFLQSQESRISCVCVQVAHDSRLTADTHVTCDETSCCLSASVPLICLFIILLVNEWLHFCAMQQTQKQQEQERKQEQDNAAKRRKSRLQTVWSAMTSSGSSINHSLIHGVVHSTADRMMAGEKGGGEIGGKG